MLSKRLFIYLSSFNTSVSNVLRIFCSIFNGSSVDVDEVGGVVERTGLFLLLMVL